MERNDWKRDSEIKVSIIIPVYNGEEYLEQCIQSALNQTMEELEIICVDDGSTDRSAEIIGNFAKKDLRIVFIQQDNQGPGPARNAGIQRARGEYIAFLDADDFYLNEDALLLMYSICKEKNVSVCGSRKLCMRISEDKITKVLVDEAQNKVLNYKNYQMDFFYQNYMFQRTMLIENHISFPNYRRYQDPPFFVKALYCAELFAVADTCLYCYRASEIKPKFDTLKTTDMLKGVIDNLRFAKEHSLDMLFYRTAERLEKEFAEIIYENFSFENLEILQLLLNANQMIREQTNDKDFILWPLKLILFSENQYGNKIAKRITTFNEIALYGAGRYTRIFLRFLKRKNLLEKVTTIVVSDLKENATQLEGIPVIALKNFLDGEKKFLFVTTGKKNQKEISDCLERYNYKDYELVEELFFERLQEEERLLK